MLELKPLKYGGIHNNIMRLTAIIILLSFSFYPNMAHAFLGKNDTQQEEYDTQRLNDILKISDLIESYHKKNNHYPLVKEPQAKMVVSIISDNIPSNFPLSIPYKKLEFELQKTLGNRAVLPKDPEDKGLFYQYATDGQNFYVSAFLYHKKPYAWEQRKHINKVEISNRPNLRSRQHKPDYLRHVLKYGPENEDTQTKLFLALQERSFDKAAIMIQNGANPSPTCGFNHRCQPLATAAMEGDLELIRFLIDHGADIDGYNAYDDVALIYALSHEKTKAAKLLIESGANVNIPNAFGISPFIGATASGDIELVTLMIQNGADLNKNYLVHNSSAKPGEKNMRPLEFAITHNQPEIISLLLRSGANASLNTLSGETITELGKKSKHETIRKLF